MHSPPRHRNSAFTEVDLSVVVLDANVLYPARLRDFFIRLAIAGMFRARWSDIILDECFDNIRHHNPELDPVRLNRTRDLMNAAVVDATVTNFEHLIENFDLPDPNDRHVTAAAIASGATAIVTFNLRDFPTSALATHGLTAISPDDFARQLHRYDPDAVLEVLTEQATNLRNPRTTLDELLDGLRHAGLTSFVDAVRTDRSW
jgi:predicted nucleic acid-binding protein